MSLLQDGQTNTWTESLCLGNIILDVLFEEQRQILPHNFNKNIKILEILILGAAQQRNSGNSSDKQSRLGCLIFKISHNSGLKVGPRQPY